MIEEVRMVFNGNWFIILMIAALLAGAIFCKGKRKIFFVPAIITSVLILNPVAYEYWQKISSYGYWRLLWILPVAPACAMIPAYAVEKIKNNAFQIMIIGTSVVILVACGFYVFNYANSTFTEATNADKLPEDVIAVADALLELDERPYIVTDSSLSQYLRQYSGKIKSLYARDVVFGGANSGLAADVYQNLSSEDGSLLYVSQMMLNHDYEYLVTRNMEKERKTRLDDAGFELIRQVNDYGIYRPTKGRTEVRTYDDLRQVTSITFIDEQGNPKNCEYGYAVEKYEKVGDYSYTYYYSADGKKLDMGSGCMHEYLEKLQSENVSLIISVKDEASYALTSGIVNDLKMLGMKTDLRGNYRLSYYAVITPDEVIEEVGKDRLSYTGAVNGQDVSIISAGAYAGSESSIIINGTEYSKNLRGMNIVVIDNATNQVIDSITFDTCAPQIFINR